MEGTVVSQRQRAGRRDSRAVLAGRQALAGKRRGLRAVLPFLGPSMIAAIAYVDPGNFATNIESGSEFGYNLLWVVLAANLMAMVIQNLSAKLGLATGKNLPELCREHLPAWVSVLLWLIAEVAAMATDLAEFLGASLALNLMLHIPLLPAAVVTGVVTYLMLTLDRFGFRPLELVIGALLGVIALCYLAETVLSQPDWGMVARHAVTPWMGGRESVMLAVGIIGATVMPHAVYLHSGLTQRRIQPRTEDEAVRIYRFQRIDVMVAMTVAGLVNLAMMYMSAATFHGAGYTGIASIDEAYRTLQPLLGPAAAWVFLISLLASGLSSSTVGTMAGQVIMQGFVGFRIPVWVRRVVTMLPTLVIIGAGVDPMHALVLSQVVLSLALPAPLLALVWFTRNPKLMGPLVNRPWVTGLALAISLVVLTLNGVYLGLTLAGEA
ncbi:MAG: Nramp family divalent metal transporter [Alicyclobacillus macrosporangiidus]|uniref:Nramp family divalent metal transporter n=1 Tax=Alicyclobacillus macrosporangiidus TaxID=392015 RepID=UPI0026EB7C9C|nr:Nramp family divalent metal transporter [Alicyclobacillus macrosporangiidus]MCL6599445.1 Nramp family divalent metal transporter [Alicyclobacillus macrosporangiidus]